MIYKVKRFSILDAATMTPADYAKKKREEDKDKVSGTAKTLGVAGAATALGGVSYMNSGASQFASSNTARYLNNAGLLETSGQINTAMKSAAKGTLGTEVNAIKGANKFLTGRRAIGLGAGIAALGSIKAFYDQTKNKS